MVSDEADFCCRLPGLEHLHACALAFVNMLWEFDRILESKGSGLDVKGRGCVVIFSMPNVVLPVSERIGEVSATDVPTIEDVEAA